MGGGGTWVHFRTFTIQEAVVVTLNAKINTHIAKGMFESRFMHAHVFLVGIKGTIKSTPITHLVEFWRVLHNFCVFFLPLLHLHIHVLFSMGGLFPRPLLCSVLLDSICKYLAYLFESI